MLCAVPHLKKWLRRPYEKAALCAVRTLVLLWARQCRKSTTLGAIAFDEMSRAPGRRVIAASASLLLGSELVSKSVTALEHAATVAREAAALQHALLSSLAQSENPLSLVAANSETGAEYRSLTADDFTALYRAGRLEIRLYHSHTAFSRLQVISAPASSCGGPPNAAVVQRPCSNTPEFLAVNPPACYAPRGFLSERAIHRAPATCRPAERGRYPRETN